MTRLASSLIVLVGTQLVSMTGPSQSSPLWGTLIAGPHAAGYTTRFVADRSRTWAVPKDQPAGSRIDTRGRPVRISMWYPAAAGDSRMRIADYVTHDAPSGFADAEAVLERRDRTVVSEWAPPEANASLMATTTDAYRDAPPAAGRFPLVLYAAGINPYTLSNAVLAEFLATHGFITVAVSSLGPSPELPEQSYNNRELEDSMRDLEFAWANVRDDRNIDPIGLAAVGHSLGGSVALLIALQNANVRAMVGLDGTYGFGGADATAFKTLLNPSRVRVPPALLDIHRSDANIDLSVLAFDHSDRYFVRMPRMFHGDFTSFVMGAEAFHLPPPPNAAPDWTQAMGAAGYQQVCEGILEFLRSRFGGSDDAFRKWQVEMAHHGASVAHEPPAVR